MYQRRKKILFWCNDYGNQYENSCAMVLNNHVGVFPTEMSFFAVVSYLIFSMNPKYFIFLFTIEHTIAFESERLWAFCRHFVSSCCCFFSHLILNDRITRRMLWRKIVETVNEKLIDSFRFRSIDWAVNRSVECLKANFQFNTKFFTTNINNRVRLKQRDQ